MKQNWLETTDRADLVAKRMWQRYPNSHAAVANILMKYRERFEICDDLIRQQTGSPDFDGVTLALMRTYTLGLIRTSEYHIRAGRETLRGQNVDLFGSGFDYKYLPLRELNLTCPIGTLHPEMIEEVQKISRGQVLNTLHWISDHCHDVFENMMLPPAVDQMSGNVRDVEEFHRLYEGARPSEQGINAIHHMVMEVYLSRKGRLEEVISKTISCIDKVAEYTRKGDDDDWEFRRDAGRFLIKRLFSNLLYHLPMADKLEIKTGDNGRSIKDAMDDYGFDWLISLEEIDRFRKQRGLYERPPVKSENAERIGQLRFILRLLDPEEDYIRYREVEDRLEQLLPPEPRFDAEKVLPELAQYLAREETPRNYAYYAGLKIIEACHDKKNNGMDVKTSGLNAVFMMMIAEGGRDYDLAHFWTGKVTGITMIPPGMAMFSSPIKPHEQDMYNMLYEKSGAEAGKGKVEAAEIMRHLWEMYTDTPMGLALNKHAKMKIKKFATYLRNEASDEVRQFLLPRVERIMQVYAEHGDEIVRIANKNDRLALKQLAQQEQQLAR